MAQGFFFWSAKVAEIFPRCRRRKTREMRRAQSTPFSVVQFDQCPRPCSFVSWAATAVWSAASSAASEGAAGRTPGRAAGLFTTVRTRACRRCAGRS